MEAPIQTTPVPNTVATVFAKLVSYILHPLFIPTYLFIFLVYQFPYEFEGITDWQMKMKIFSTFWLTAFFPAFAVFLLWRLGFSNSIFLRTQKERIIPYFITMFFYWWMYYLSKNFGNQPEALKFFYFGIFAATVIGVVINVYIKISLHAIAMGGLMAAMFLINQFYQAGLTLPISITVLLTGIVCSSRLLVSNHTQLEIYSGLAVGVLCQFLGYWFVF